MRISCNGCRVLRKGCSENCSIKPCLQWMKSPESQANATVFLAKFYGRAGLMNLINAGPEDLRPAVFKSLLYEACARMVNPVDGSIGLMWSGNWNLCQKAVEAVLKGAPITQIASDAAETNNGHPLKAYDIRHVNKNEISARPNDLHRVRTRCRFKRSAAKPKASRVYADSGEDESGHEDANRSSSHESSLSHQSEAAAPNVDGESRDIESLTSVEMTEVEVEERAEKGSALERDEQDSGIVLELTLGFEPLSRAHTPKTKGIVESKDGTNGVCKMELGLA